MNYAENRKIKADRIYKTIGKMTWWRIALGIALLVLILFISGKASDMFASGGHFKAAKAVMIAPNWMEEYRPEDKAYIEAGVLYEDGLYMQAYDAFAAIKDYEAAREMEMTSALRVAEEKYTEADYDLVYRMLVITDSSLLSEEDLAAYKELCMQMCAYYAPYDEYAGRADEMAGLAE